MIENLVVAWLTDASERSYEVPFAQLLLIEGHSIIQGPMHHAYEHGKDIIARGPNGSLDVYQLKSGSGRFDTAAAEEVQPQLFAAATSAVTHPSLDVPRIPDRVILVTNQSATGPAQDRIRVFSEGNVGRGLPPVRLIEKDELVSRFVLAQDRFFPSEPRALGRFFNLFLGDGAGPLPTDELFGLLDAIIPVTGKRPRASAAVRSISSAALTTSFALRPWTEAENHREVAAGWSCYCIQVLRVVERTKLGAERWQRSYRLALEEIRRRATVLLGEASSASDLVIGDPAEILTYPARAVSVCGLVSALVVSESIEFGAAPDSARDVAKLIERELPGPKIIGEAQAPAWFLMSLALSEGGSFMLSIQLLMSWIQAISTANAPSSEAALPDPYHPIEEVLLSKLEPEEDRFGGERFAGAAYTLHVAVRWVCRRLWRQALASVWTSVSRVQVNEFEPEHPIQYLYHRTDRGTLKGWYYDQPTSWRELLKSSSAHEFDRLPTSLLSRPEFLPFYCLAMPHRFNATVADRLDFVARGRTDE